jgi:hypothetical protein
MVILSVLPVKATLLVKGSGGCYLEAWRTGSNWSAATWRWIS